MDKSVKDVLPKQVNFGKFKNPDFTAKGEPRALVPLTNLETLWFNTGTLCNIECAHCYIKSSPTNDALSYLTYSEFAPFLDEIKQDDWGTREIAFTGGEPFMNPDMIKMLEASLKGGFETLVLTNAMAPMQRPKIKQALLDLLKSHGNKLTLRISLDHFTKELHDKERGKGSFEKALTGINWLVKNKFNIAIAGRHLFEEDTHKAIKGYQQLFDAQQWDLDGHNPAHLVVFPEMDENAETPEITTECWGILGKQPSSVMCASTRMVIKRKGADKAALVPCTLITEEAAFEMGATLKEAAQKDGGMFDQGAVKLCHPHCSKFCVLGGASCS